MTIKALALSFGGSVAARAITAAPAPPLECCV